ncbi:MAG TPA: DUF5686 family protein [Bacteroidales bacterium]|nr:DUF5686 family protein [Bacteroidales bacterium]
MHYIYALFAFYHYMNQCLHKKLYTFIVFVCLSSLLSGQMTRIKGIVRDAETGEPIPYASVYVKNTPLVVFTNDSGAYVFETRQKINAISVSFLGYKEATEEVDKGITQIINFDLEPNVTVFEDVVVRPGENPAHRILRAIDKNRNRNSLRLNNIQRNQYSKIQISLNNIDEKFKNRKILQPFKFVFDNVDTNAITGNVYLPIMIAESSIDHYSQNDPSFKKDIVRATKISGIQDETIINFFGGLNQSFDVYSSYMDLYTESGFISPIADNGLLFYKYYLLDSAVRAGHKCYHISFKPRRKQERTFFGDFWVADSSFALQSMTMRLNPQANVNFITDLYAEYSFYPENDSLWPIRSEFIQMDFNLAEMKRVKGVQGKKTVIYSNYKIDKPIPKEIFDVSKDAEKLDSLTNSSQIDTLRPVQLSKSEQTIYGMVDSIKNVPAFKTTYNTIRTIVEAHYSFEKFKIGPYFSLYSYNRVEGHRFRIGGVTNQNFSKRMRANGYVAYGTDDKEYKYFANMHYVVSRIPYTRITALYRHDMSQIYLAPGELLNENIVSSFIRRYDFKKLQMIDNASFNIESDIASSLSVILGTNYFKVDAGKYIPFVKPDSSEVKSINTGEIFTNIHFEIGQKFFTTKYKRFRMQNEMPAFDLNLTAGIKGMYKGEYDYLKTSLTYSQYLKTNPFGYNKYSVEVGKIFGKVPWPLLNVFKGSETYGFEPNGFNMMNYYEFVANEYLKIISEQHFQGIFFNYVPLLRKLKLREVATCKAVIGHLNYKPEMMLLPSYMYGLHQPYVELGVGVENIFKFFRIDALWRLSYWNNPDIEKFGIRLSLQFIL